MNYHLLNKEHGEQILSKLDPYLPLNCRVCDNEMTNIAHFTGKLVEAKANGQVHNLDTVNFICTNCGHIELFSAEALGVKFN
ncbi:hypothetical protein ACMVYO_04695 [Staphylococcus hominis]|uniref:hypothetical protein n=1 Tax=Staphylococcus hominis TaxID=1290 RepID=UPI0039EAAD39